jgi:hypothetical protein
VSDVFISYSHADREFVYRLVQDLELAGLTVFFDQRIASGESWADTLSKAIEGARYVLVVLSPEAVSSDWLRAETMLGLKREGDGKATVIPLMVRQCEPPLILTLKTWADFREDYHAGLRALLPVLLQSTPRAPLAENVPGGSAPDADPVELARLRTELKEAVAMFKATPQQGGVRPRNAAARRRRCFVVMPFGNEALQIVFEDFVRPVIEAQCGLDCERGDDVFGSSVIMDDIRNSIGASDIVVADLTGKNANVFY